MLEIFRTTYRNPSSNISYFFRFAPRILNLWLLKLYAWVFKNLTTFKWIVVVHLELHSFFNIKTGFFVFHSHLFP